MDAVQNFRADLVDCGLRADVVASLCDRYDRALHGVTREWNGLYHELFAALSLLSVTPARPQSHALQSVLLLLEDDLGAQLFGSDATAELRARFLQPAYALN